MLIGADFSWFAGLARRLFPQEAEAALSAPDVRTRVERFAQLFALPTARSGHLALTKAEAHGVSSGVSPLGMR